MIVTPELRRLVTTINTTLATSPRTPETQRLIGQALHLARLLDRSNRRTDAPASRWVRRRICDSHIEHRIRIPA